MTRRRRYFGRSWKPLTHRGDLTYYRISIYYRAGFGYLVEKASGAAGARPNIEVWFRPSLHQALDKQGHLVAEKLSKKRRGRIYIIVGKESEGE